jgi:hypothetical protein
MLILVMSSTNPNLESTDNRPKKRKGLESIQDNRDNVGTAESDPPTSSHAENTRADAAEKGINLIERLV